MNRIFKRYFTLQLVVLILLQVFLPNVFAEDTSPVLLVDSDLSDSSCISEIAGFDMVNWAYGRCGYSTARGIYSNLSTNNFYMIFDSGEGGKFTSAKFRFSTETNTVWILKQEADRNRILWGSNDGETWNQIGSSVMSEVENSTATIYTRDVAWEIGDGYRYIKLGGFTVTYGYQLFVHDAELYGIAGEPEVPDDGGGNGGDDPVVPSVPEAKYTFIDPCKTLTLPENEYVTAVYSDMQSVSWEWNWLSDTERTFLTSGENKDKADTIIYALKDTSKDFKYVEINFIATKNTVPLVYASRNEDIMKDSLNTELLSEEAIDNPSAWQFKRYKYICEIPDYMKYLKIDLSGIGYRMDCIKLGINDSAYIFDRIGYNDGLSGSLQNGVWTVSGSISNTSDDMVEGTLILCVYKDKSMTDMRCLPVSLVTGETVFNINAGKSGDDGSEAELYLWTSEEKMHPIIINPVLFKNN